MGNGCGFSQATVVLADHLAMRVRATPPRDALIVELLRSLRMWSSENTA